MSEGNSAPLRIVSMGGGNGLSTLLRGLKRYARIGPGSVELTAVVAVSDDGGSSGRLRRDFDVLPPGDIRNCMVALSEGEATLSRLFEYRFAGGSGLKGHSFGNLFLTAMTHLTGDFAQAVKLSSDVLAVAGRIYPCTGANIILEATLANGSMISGESRISRSTARIKKIALRPRRAKPLPETLQALAEADLITLGPGSLFTSIVPHLLVQGIPQAIASSHALKAYFMNLMTQPGETTGFLASDHVQALRNHAARTGRRLIDVCVVNQGVYAPRELERYRAREARPVEVDAARLKHLGVRVLAADLLRLNRHRGMEKIRHDPGAIAGVAMDLALEGRRVRRRLAS